MRPTGITVMLLLGVALPAAAQHGVLAGAAGAGDCNVCHAPHTRGTGVYTLRMGEGGPWFGRAGALGMVSQSCLRCHGAAQVRRRQPEFSRTGLAEGREPAYLGFDFADDHPLGRAGQLRGASTAPARGRFTVGGLTPGGTLEIERSGLECTRCHDPHRRQGATPQPEDEAALCGACHDAAALGQGHQDTPCSDCHRLHGGTRRALLGHDDPDMVCRGCHDPTVRSLPAGPASAAAALAPPAHTRDLQPRAGRCVDCHTVHR